MAGADLAEFRFTHHKICYHHTGNVTFPERLNVTVVKGRIRIGTIIVIG